MGNPFEHFESADLLRLWPPFGALIVIGGLAYTKSDALGAWRRHHGTGFARRPRAEHHVAVCTQRPVCKVDVTTKQQPCR